MSMDEFCFQPELTLGNSVSIGVGLQSPAHLQDWSTIEPLTNKANSLPVTTNQQLQIELFRNKVTAALASNPESELMTKPTHERLPLYKLLNADWSVLEATLGKTNGRSNPLFSAAQPPHPTNYI
jgi:hypothetical protein